MSQPAVNITELDGQLGILPPSSGNLLAFVGYSTSGPLNTPATFGRIKDVIATFGAGPLVEAACHAIETYGNPVIIVRTGSTVAGSAGTINDDGVTGTSVVTIDTAPNDDYEFYLRVITGGTVGTTGITFVYSLDGGRTLSPVQSLGTAVTWPFPGAGGTNVDFAAGTLIAGDYITSRGSAAQWNTAELTAAVTALASSAATWELLEVVGAIDANAFDALEVRFAAMHTAGKYRAWVGNTRIPNVGESEATYLSALTTIFSSKATTYGELCAGACKLLSSVSGRIYKRPISFSVAARQAKVAQHVNIADVNLGTLPGVAIADSNGNPDEHDESINPGLDDARFTVLRTWEGIQGVYVNRPRVFSAAGSDFELLAHRRVMNLALAALRIYFIRRLNTPILINPDTGYILETEARAIESGALAVMRAALMATPKASGVQFVLSRTDNLISTKTLTGDARVIPLGYAETINLSVGYANPALIAQAA